MMIIRIVFRGRRLFRTSTNAWRDEKGPDGKRRGFLGGGPVETLAGRRTKEKYSPQLNDKRSRAGPTFRHLESDSPGQSAYTTRTDLYCLT